MIRQADVPEPTCISSSTARAFHSAYDRWFAKRFPDGHSVFRPHRQSVPYFRPKQVVVPKVEAQPKPPPIPRPKPQPKPKIVHDGPVVRRKRRDSFVHLAVMNVANQTADFTYLDVQQIIPDAHHKSIRRVLWTYTKAGVLKIVAVGMTGGTGDKRVRFPTRYAKVL